MLWVDGRGRGCNTPHEIWLMLGELHSVRSLLPPLRCSQDAGEDVLGAVTQPFLSESWVEARKQAAGCSRHRYKIHCQPEYELQKGEGFAWTWQCKSHLKLVLLNHFSSQPILRRSCGTQLSLKPSVARSNTSWVQVRGQKPLCASFICPAHTARTRQEKFWERLY